jgi:hypothetical protein
MYEKREGWNEYQVSLTESEINGILLIRLVILKNVKNSLYVVSVCVYLCIHIYTYIGDDKLELS